MKNFIKWAVPMLLVGIIAACTFFKTDKPEISTNDSIPEDSVTKVIETDTLPQVEQDSVAHK